MRWLHLDVSEVLRMYLDEGASCGKIAKTMGVSSSTIHTRLVRSGVQIRNPKEAAIETYRRGRTHPKKGVGCLNERGYVVTLDNGVQRRMHVLIAEAAIGSSLPQGAVVHHVNGNRSDNRNANLVVCPSAAYHALLHRRQKALDECGNANWLMCRYCKQYDKPENLHTFKHCSKYPDNVRAYHRECSKLYQRTRTQTAKETT